MNGQTSNRGLVSVVDDDAAMRDSTCWLLRSCGFEAESFASAPEFLASPKKARTACLILDVRMPGMNGVELQSRLTEENASIPIIFITAYADGEEERHAKAGGPLAFLRKPLKEDALLAAVREALKQSNKREP
jgi:FixJ family two-component response regulator